MPRYELNQTYLEVHLNFLDRVSTLQPSFKVPLNDIRGATLDPGVIPSQLGFRAPGTGLPWVIAAGTWFKNGDRQFVCWYRGHTPVVIELKNHKFARLILGSKDARELVDAINQSLI